MLVQYSDAELRAAAEEQSYTGAQSRKLLKDYKQLRAACRKLEE